MGAPLYYIPTTSIMLQQASPLSSYIGTNI